MAQQEANSALLANSGSNSGPCRCAWLGPTSGGLRWLFQRLASPAPCSAPLTVTRYAEIDIDLLQSLSAAGGLERIILACSTRLEYPRQAIDFLQRSCPDIPFAVACDSWWDGARRTGLGSMEALALPWYRWWDGWLGWLEGCAPELFSPCQPSVAPWAQTACRSLPHSRQRVDGQSSLTAQNSPAPQPPPMGIIVGNCRRTCEAWAGMGQAVGFQTKTYSWHKFQQPGTMQSSHGVPQWILWDDSCLNTSGPQAVHDLALEHFIESARTAFPETWLIAAMSLPRADQWHHSPAAKAPELIVKPDGGQGLSRLLMHIGSTAAALQPH